MVVSCQPYAPAAFTPRKCSWYSFLSEVESTPGPHCDRKNFMSTKNPLAPAGIEPATFRFVAQHLNHCATAVPKVTTKACYNCKTAQFKLLITLRACFRIHACGKNSGGSSMQIDHLCAETESVLDNIY